MVFTQEDAQDDSKIKRDIKSDLARKGREQSPRIWEHFVNVCESMDQSPSDVLADMFVRALNDQEYADDIEAEEVTMQAISRGEYRKEDIAFVKELASEFGLEPQEKESVVDKIIERRIDSVASSPFDRGERNGQDTSRLERRLDELERENQRLRQEVGENQQQETRETEQMESVPDEAEEERKEIDELFGDDGDVEEVEEVEVEMEEPETDEETEDAVDEVEDGVAVDEDTVPDNLPEISAEKRAGDVEGEELEEDEE